MDDSKNVSLFLDKFFMPKMKVSKLMQKNSSCNYPGFSVHTFVIQCHCTVYHSFLVGHLISYRTQASDLFSKCHDNRNFTCKLFLWFYLKVNFQPFRLLHKILIITDYPCWLTLCIILAQPHGPAPEDPGIQGCD